MIDDYEACWVDASPSDPTCPERLGLAFDWLANAHHPGRRVVVLHAVKMANNTFLQRAKRFTVVSPRSRSRLAHDEVGAVLAIWPDDRAFELAEQLAVGSALCVVPGPGHPMSWWLHRTSATNLSDPGTEPFTLEALEPAVIEALDTVILLGGHNGFLGGGDKDLAVAELRALHRSGHRPTASQIEHYVRANSDVPAGGARRLSGWWQAVLDGRRLRG